MRPERFRYEMNRAFDTWIADRTTHQFFPLLREMKRVWLKWAKQEDDYQTGNESYGYKEDNSNCMMYISDRWRCAFRLKWLIDGLEANKI